ncbi:uncharacterized protein Z519_09485 [Cladophialophora bantiana CBS 173.52]|uniref:YTH domain-containing protein n=1 Tax=Cladophialophora bantiana (strain ATCC 10958 / CBS 173.52 / CDC B-1940 / NIH 8579) TaxID=1442370 RepID=A0A0D2HZQ9_CLAB1|nr:uncharacterized protein Z519_09485 [Cladophialophora bantiana CBS 173.52]KIW90054.1 hypothetical protein Z519_09485 [Cladophialophora bantiana CBS 173.52]
MSLRDYFSEPSPWDLLSVSYNPDARYAFVNFSSESARLSAIRQAASRLFDGRRLDCRIRQGSMSRSTKVNYGLNNIRGPLNRSSSICCDRAKSLWGKVEEFSHFPEADRSSWGMEKYFIIKSFSLEALYQSLETGRWHVPKRHIERLNHAFQTASKVYLIFSVNGSGCFFGYATMRSEIQVDEDDPALDSDEVHISRHDCDVDDDSGSSQAEAESYLQPTPRSRTESLASSDSSSSSSSSSSGSIVYQPERRRIIWAASWPRRTIREFTSPEEHPPASVAPSPAAVSSSYFTNESSTQSQPLAEPAPRDTTIQSPPSRHPCLSSAESILNRLCPGEHRDTSFLDRFSSPCPIKWLSTQSLPFSAVRGLTNPWNDDKEVHIARNVTPVEPGVAAALLGCWGAVAAKEGKKTGTREMVRGGQFG